MSKGDNESKLRAKELAESIRDRNTPPSIDSMNRIYDVVLNMNSLNSKPGDGKHFMISQRLFLSFRCLIPTQRGESKA